MPFINFTEMCAARGSFDIQEVNAESKSGTTTIYGGYAPAPDPADPHVYDKQWLICRIVVTESGGTQNIQCTWARAPWNLRANPATVYQFGKP